MTKNKNCPERLQTLTGGGGTIIIIIMFIFVNIKCDNAHINQFYKTTNYYRDT